MLVSYPAIFYKEKDTTGYTVMFPDLPGCISYDEDKNSALSMAQEALGLYLYDYFLENKLPNSSNIQELLLENDDEESFCLEQSFTSLVGIDMEKYSADFNNKTIRKNITLPAWLNTKAEAAGINFSQTLQDALKKKLG